MKRRTAIDRPRQGGPSASALFGLRVLLERIDAEAMTDFLNCELSDEESRRAVRAAVEAVLWIANEAGVAALRRCRECGCTDECGCPVGCWWVGDSDLCSACVPSGIEAAVKRAVRRGRARKKRASCRR